METPEERWVPRKLPKACGRKLAPGQGWWYCGQHDIDSSPAFCIECYPEEGLLLRGATPEEVEALNAKLQKRWDDLERQRKEQENAST